MARTLATVIPSEVHIGRYFYPLRAIVVAALVGAICAVVAVLAITYGIDAANL